jgi:hypothetical protein
MGEPFASSTSPSASSSRKEELWTGPPPPPDAQQVARDLSCQGIIAFTLKETLDEMLSEQSSDINQQQEPIIDQTHLNLDSTATATANGTEETEGLAPVLQTPPVRLDQPMVTRILQAFGTSVAHSQQERYAQQQQQQPKVHHQGNANSNATVEPPAALLRGSIGYYNRRNSKWRILLQDADFQRRQPLEKNRRKRERSSLWREQDGNGNTGGESTSTATTTTTTTNPTKNSTASNCTLEILAYNDLE